jgi:hypothetical protein
MGIWLWFILYALGSTGVEVAIIYIVAVRLGLLQRRNGV